MQTEYYLNEFQKAANQLDQRALSDKQMEMKVGIWVDSAVLKMQKQTWRNNSPGTVPFEKSIFFSIWISDEEIKKDEIRYNLHALKLRQLSKYTIQSRDFAQAFRLKFKPFEKDWPNVKTDYGPLTLMEGWVPKIDDLENTVRTLADKFLQIAFIIDELLEQRLK